MKIQKYSLMSKIMVPFCLFMIMVILIVMLVFYNVTKSQAIHQSQDYALSTIDQFKIIRTYYNNNVVAKIMKNKDLPIKTGVKHQGDD